MARTALTVRLLRVLLGLAAAFVLVFNVLVTVHPVDDVPLLRQPVPNVSVMQGTGFEARWRAAEPDASGKPVLFPWSDDSSDGTRDAATGLPAVELSIGDQMRLYFWGPTTLDRVTFVLPPLAWAALALIVLWLLWRIVGTIAADDVFSRANIRRIVVIGALIAGGATVVQLGSYWLKVGTVARSAAAGVVVVPFQFDLVPLWAGALIVLLAVVLHQGVRLRQDVEGLV